MLISHAHRTYALVTRLLFMFVCEKLFSPDFPIAAVRKKHICYPSEDSLEQIGLGTYFSPSWSTCCTKRIQLHAMMLWITISGVYCPRELQITSSHQPSSKWCASLLPLSCWRTLRRWLGSSLHLQLHLFIWWWCQWMSVPNFLPHNAATVPTPAGPELIDVTVPNSNSKWYC